MCSVTIIHVTVLTVQSVCIPAKLSYCVLCIMYWHMCVVCVYGKYFIIKVQSIFL